MSGLRELACRFVPGVHPDFACLLRRADGYRSSHIEAHLHRCPKCYEEAARLRNAAAHAHGGPVLDDIFDNLQLRMRAWCSLGGLMPERKAAAPRSSNARLSEALEVYFGREAARRIQSCAPWNAPDHGLVPVTKPLFTAFLGRRAAEALADRIAAAT